MSSMKDIRTLLLHILVFLQTYCRSFAEFVEIPSRRCSPIFTNQGKLNLLTNYWQNVSAVPLYFWHIQKAGGSSFCAMLRHRYHQVLKLPDRIRSPDCNNNVMSRQIVEDFTTWETIYRPQGFNYVGMEASNLLSPEGFPRNYREKLSTKILLNSAAEYSSRSSIAWNSMLHVMVLRHPVELALSAFNYHFQGTNKSMVDACKHHNINANDCMLEAFRVMENVNKTSPYRHPFWEPQLVARIRSEILGNYTINHLSINSDINEAKRNLQRFTLVVDLSMSAVSSHLMRCTLGWTNIRRPATRNMNSVSPSQHIVDELTEGTLARLTDYLKYEIQFYNFAIGGMLKHYETAVSELYK